MARVSGALRSAGTGLLAGVLALVAVCARGQAGIADTPLPHFADGKQSVLVRAVPGVVKRNGLETDFICTALGAQVVNIGAEVFDSDGARLNDVSTGAGAVLDVHPGQTVTIGTGGTAAFLESTIIALPSVAQGSARILATSRQVQCVALIVDSATAPPVASAMIGNAVRPGPTTLLSRELPRFPNGKLATHAIVIPGVVNRGRLETDFFCTSLASEPIDIGVEILGTDGEVLNSVAAGNGALLDVAPGATVTLGTTGTAAFLETAIISAPGVAQGLARVVSTSEEVLCNAVVLDSTAAPPTSMSELVAYRGVAPVGTVTATPSLPPNPTPTSTPTTVPSTPSPRSTLTPIVVCTGDCSRDGAVSIDELIKGVRIALETAPVDTCPQFDFDQGGSVSVNELVRAVNVALNGCVEE